MVGYKTNWQIISPVGGEPKTQKNQESSKLLSQIKQDDFVILLDESGDLLNNQELVDTLQKININSFCKRVCFIIGGSYGVNNDIKSRANITWSLSKLIFPHQLVCLILVEQLYRSYCIVNNHPYHHQ